jgi:hypothetical protein
MLRVLLFTTLLSLLMFGLIESLSRVSAAAKADAILELRLPASAEPPSRAPERVSKLEIDGKDFSTPRSTRRTVAVTLKPGATSVKIVYTFWPNVYTRITRTRTVAVEKGATIPVSLLADDPANDRIWVIYVPTPNAVVEAMCKLAKVGKDDVVYDIGCGDGRLVIAAVKKFGAKKGVGIDLLPERIAECKANARKAGVEDRVTFLQKDALTIKDFSEASVVLLYLSDALNEALRPALRKTLPPGARIVSHRFKMGDWMPEKTEEVEVPDDDGDLERFDLHLWRLPKK